jgi:hypothetical protein
MKLKEKLKMDQCQLMLTFETPSHDHETKT